MRALFCFTYLYPQPRNALWYNVEDTPDTPAASSDSGGGDGCLIGKLNQE